VVLLVVSGWALGQRGDVPASPPSKPASMEETEAERDSEASSLELDMRREPTGQRDALREVWVVPDRHGRTDKPIEELLYPVSVDGWWGLADERGRIVVYPQWDWSDYVYEGVHRVVVDGWTYYLRLFCRPLPREGSNPDGTPRAFAYGDRFSEGVAVVGGEGGVVLIDRTGRRVGDVRADLMLRMNEGYAAALVDGLSIWGAFGTIILPIAAPGMVAAFILCLVLTWNEYFFAALLTSTNAKTLIMFTVDDDQSAWPYATGMTMNVLVPDAKVFLGTSAEEAVGRSFVLQGVEDDDQCEAGTWCRLAATRASSDSRQASAGGRSRRSCRR